MTGLLTGRNGDAARAGLGSAREGGGFMNNWDNDRQMPKMEFLRA